ncbi:MAG: hypothetical protein K2X87_13885 [Gemmataceae bacterium]|nr:hypothetical protein [Gemmataceae bacterium]
MAVATFDTLKFANTLKEAGVQARAFAEIVQVNIKDLTTKDDLSRAAEDLRKDLRQEIKDAEQRVNAKIDNAVAELKLQLAQVRNEQVIVRWMLGATFAGVLTGIGLLSRILFLLPR